MTEEQLIGGFPLKPLSGRRPPKSKEFHVCDIESMDWTRFLVIGHYNGEKFVYFKRLIKYFAYLFAQKKNIQVFAHFGGKFDFMFLLQEAFAIPNLQVSNMIPRGSGVLCFDLSNEDTTITFFDSSAILPFSLERICKAFGVEHKKLSWDHSKTRKVTKKLVHYLKHDCIGLYEAIEKYRDWDLIRKAGPKSTMASQALQVLRLFLDKEVYSLSDHVDTFVRRSYFGGRTEVFRPLYIGEEPIRCYDVNSLYPTVMRANEFPNCPEMFTDIYYPNKMGFYDAIVEVPKNMYVPPLGTVERVGINDKFIFPTGTFKGRWSTIELEYARSVGVKIVKTGRGVVFSSAGNLFQNFIDTLYSMRLNAKRTGDKTTDTLTKLLMNSTYGRFGLNKDRKNLIVDDGAPGREKYCEVKTPLGLVPLAVEAKRLDKTFTNVAVAAWVTSLARIHMHKIMSQCKDSLYYTDTDSVFTTKELPEGENLGDLKLEYMAKAACFLLPKTYIINGILDDKEAAKTDLVKKVVMKGFGTRKIKEFTMDDFVTALEGELRVLRVEFKPRGIMTMKTALRHGKFLAKPLETSREIRSHYDKRKLFRRDGMYDTEPLFINSHLPNSEASSRLQP